MDTKKLRQKILDLAIRGKLVPQDLNDEPASVLLECIRAEKERLIAEGKIKRPKRAKSSSAESHYQNFDPPFPIPESWTWCILSDCCHIAGRIGFRGYTKDDLVSERNGAITLSPSNIVNGSMQYDTCTYISWNKYHESPEIQVQNNDILLVKTGSSFGKCALVKDLPQEATINPQYVVLKHIMVSPEYLTILLQSRYARNCYERFVLGTAIPTFTQEKLGSLAVPMPPYQEQLRIIQKLHEIQSAIESIIKNKQELESCIKKTKSMILDLAMQGKLVPQDPTDEPASDMLLRINSKAKIITDNPHYPQLPSVWCIATINDVFEINPKNKADGDMEAGFVPMASICNGFNNTFVYTPRKWDEIKNGFTHFANGDIAVAKISPCLENRKSMILKNLPNGIGSGTTELLVFRSKVIYPEYGLLFFKSDDFIKQCMGTFNGVVGQQRIGKKIVEEIPIPIPPYKAQMKIANEVKRLFDTLDQINSNLAN